MVSSFGALKGMNNLNKQMQEGLRTEESYESAPQEEPEQPPASEWKQPRPIYDIWPQTTQKVRQLMVQLTQTLQERSDFQRMGKSSAKQDYYLRRNSTTLTQDLQTLEQAADYYKMLTSHAETDYSKVFLKNTYTTPKTLSDRLTEWVEIADSAQPILQMIETNTTDQVAINAALLQQQRERSFQQSNQGQFGDAANNLPDEDLEKLQSYSNQDLIAKAQTEVARQDALVDTIEEMTKMLKYGGQDMDTELKRQKRMMSDIKDKIDYTAMGLRKVDGRLDKLVSEMSFCRMWCVVVAEIVMLILIMCL